MFLILATRGASRKPSSGGDETVIPGAHSLVYKPGVAPVAHTGQDDGSGPKGTFAQGIHRLAGVLYLFDAMAAETLYVLTQEIDLIIRYRADGGQPRKRTFQNVLFMGDSTVTLPTLNQGIPELIGVSFRMQLPEGTTLADGVLDEADSS